MSAGSAALGTRYPAPEPNVEGAAGTVTGIATPIEIERARLRTDSRELRTNSGRPDFGRGSGLHPLVASVAVALERERHHRVDGIRGRG